MCGGPRITYEEEEAELVDEFRTGEMSLEAFEEKLAALRKFWIENDCD